MSQVTKEVTESPCLIGMSLDFTVHRYQNGASLSTFQTGLRLGGRQANGKANGPNSYVVTGSRRGRSVKPSQQPVRRTRRHPAVASRSQPRSQHHHCQTEDEVRQHGLQVSVAATHRQQAEQQRDLSRAGGVGAPPLRNQGAGGAGEALAMRGEALEMRGGLGQNTVLRVGRPAGAWSRGGGHATFFVERILGSAGLVGARSQGSLSGPLHRGKS